MANGLNIALHNKIKVFSAKGVSSNFKENYPLDYKNNSWCIFDLSKIFTIKEIILIIDNKDKELLLDYDLINIYVSDNKDTWNKVNYTIVNNKFIITFKNNYNIQFIKILLLKNIENYFNIIDIQAFINNLILSARSDALGSRLFCIINGMVIAKKIGFNHGFMWPKLNHDYMKNDKLTGMSLDSVDSIFSKKYISLFYYDSDYFKATSPLSIKKKSISDLKQKPFDMPWGYYAPLGYNFTDYNDKEFRKLFKEEFFSIDFHDNIKSILNKASDIASNIGNFISLHLRGGDIIHGEASKQFQKACYNKVFLAEVALDIIKKELKNDYKIILFGDDRVLLENLKLLFNQNNKIIIVEDLINIRDYTTTQISFFDIYLMSFSKKIYRAGSSLFSRFAYALSNAEMINIFEYYSYNDLYNIISNNLTKIDIEPPIRKACSYFYLYLLSKKIPMPLTDSLNLINTAISIYKDNYLYYSIFKIDCYINLKNFDIVENLLRENITNNHDLFFKYLFFVYVNLVHNEEINSLLKIETLVNLDKYIYIRYTIAKIYYNKKNYIKCIELCAVKVLSNTEDIIYNNFVDILTSSCIELLKILQTLKQENLTLKKIRDTQQQSVNKINETITENTSLIEFYKLNGSAKQKVRSYLTYRLGYLLCKQKITFFNCIPIFLKICILNLSYPLYKYSFKGNNVKLKDFPDYKEALQEMSTKEYIVGKSLLSVFKYFLSFNINQFIKELKKVSILIKKE